MQLTIQLTEIQIERSKSFLIFDSTILNISLQAGHFLKKLENLEKLDLSSFLITNLSLLAFIIIGYLLIVTVFTMVLPKLPHASNSLALKSLRRVLFVDHTQLPRVHLRFIFLFFSVFLFFNRNFLSCAIKTDNVTVRTDAIVDSTSKLLNTPKMLLIYQRESNLLLKAPEGSFLHRLSRKQILVLTDLSDLIRMQEIGVERYLFLNEEVLLPYLMSFLASHANEIGSVAFIKPTGYYESLVGLRIRRSLVEERKRFINSR